MAGLRERKKQQTRDALSLAALHLCLERGWSAVTMEDVAEAAGVSVRTLGNYFPRGKAEAIASRHLDRMRAAADALDERPVDEPLAESVTRAVLTQFTGGTTEGTDATPPDPDRQRATRFVLAAPELEAEVLRANAMAEQRLTEVLARRTGSDPDHDLRPALTAALLVAAVGFALNHWLRADPPVALEPLLREVLDEASRGFSGPDGEGKR
ncbi:TetR/AcrR family transcriptional regulator [Pseudonocardia endophytica]|uniref:TetR/AcrR family transcriptional regulator n=1 Tax=Pseudonocardia endophytica TaxID=401976 RepID=UPI001FB373D3|nr:TetR/AcrR family transcriptional regulator [Pseudonocardia endophytica]